MGKGFTPAQQSKFQAAKRYIKNSKDMDCLYAMVVIIGPALFGAVIKSNSDTVWSRVEKPGQFRYDEIVAYSKIFDLSVMEFLEIIQKQIDYNHEQLKKRRPIGRARYQEPS